MSHEDLQESVFRAKLSPEELESYLAWWEALDRWEDDGVKVEDFDARFCNKAVSAGNCILWPQHHGNCTRYFGP